MKRGLVIGKFYPPHKGHHYLIDVALSQSDQLDVLVCDHPKYRIAADQRAGWLQARHPLARVRIIEDIERDDDSLAWARHTKRYLGYSPDIIFSSEDYGDPYAAVLGAQHRKIDRDRKRINISGTVVRADVLKNWQFLEPNIRSSFAFRVCVLGAESTGTTTLVDKLSRHYKAPKTPEYGRIFTEALPNPFKYKWQTTDFVHIAEVQQQIEDQLAGASKGLLICDTNAFATRIWHQRYIGHYSPAVDQVAERDKVDLYIITSPDIPFIQDGFRDGQEIRLNMHHQFIEQVTASKVACVIVAGSVSQRLATACQQIDQLLQQGRSL